MITPELQSLIMSIENSTLVQCLTDFFDNEVNPRFFTEPSSSTGKYHPLCDQGEGGLVRHTVRVAEMATSLLILPEFHHLSEHRDEIIAAALIHDTFKYDDECVYTKHEHPVLAAQAFEDRYIDILDENIIDLISSMVGRHHGQWTKSSHSDVVLPEPRSDYDRFLHLCDFEDITSY